MPEAPTMQDVKSRIQHLEAELRQQRRYHDISRTLFSISNAISTTTTLDELYRSIHLSLGAIIDTRNFYIALYHPEKDSVTFPYCVDSVDECYPPVLGISETESLTAEVIRKGLPLFILKDEIMRRGGIRVPYPVMYAGRGLVRGAIENTRRHSGRHGGPELHRCQSI